MSFNFDGGVADLALEVLRGVAEIVTRTTGGTVRLDMERANDPKFLFAIFVDDVEWTCAREGEDGDVEMTQSPVFLDALERAGVEVTR